MTSFLPPHPTGRIDISSDQDGAVATLSGEVDAATVDRFELSRAGAPPPRIGVIDVQGVTFLSSSGVGLLLRLTQEHRRAGGRPVLRGPAGRTRHVLRLTGVEEMFDVAPSAEPRQTEE